eukprot:955222-Rhodomonas_salina.1
MANLCNCGPQTKESRHTPRGRGDARTSRKPGNCARSCIPASWMGYQDQCGNPTEQQDHTANAT